MVHQSQLLISIASGCILGVIIGSYSQHTPVLGALCIVIAAVVVVTRPNRHRYIIALICIGLGIGFFRQALYQSPVLHQGNTGWQTVQGVIRGEPELRISTQRFRVDSAGQSGDLQVTAPLHPRRQPGEIVEVSCVIEAPEPFDGFAYDKYLERYGISALCRYPKINVLGQQNTIWIQLLHTKRHLAHRLQQVMPAPEHTILLGTIFGYKKAIPESVMTAFRQTGTSHILVISGLHIALIGSIALKVGNRILPRQKALALSIICIGLYAALTGFQSSAIRASIFGLAAISAEVTGRSSQSMRIVVYAAAIMLLINPLLFRYDAGFQLSFAASSGIILFHSWFLGRLWFLPSAFAIRESAAISLAAILTTTPIIGASFGSFSGIAVIANVIVVPLMPLIMIYGFVVVVTAAASISIAQIIALPLYGILAVLIDIIQWLSALPHAHQVIENGHWLWWLYIPIAIAAYWQLIQPARA